ncbi:synaptobrevin-1-like [Dreissena polymorpha]|uniref:V-SNARE coiled-coil homology domain-containing protein n=1 Tax=Dreissena polymorpha TaxID=45954 RepID=A0A9D4LGW5_DREPO|nr:synaptobrevin-1-like [Dreissena polymorpha]KAH3857508.1 hypothetical protein DPMN_100117 [Dreissena polymorpha]
MSLKRSNATRRGQTYGAIHTEDEIGERHPPFYPGDNGDPGVISRGQSSTIKNDAVERLRGQVDEVKHIMTDNIEKVIERGEKTSELSYRTENLAETSNTFLKNATDVRKAAQFRNCKLICCIVVVVIVIVGAVTLLVLHFTKVI